MRERSIRVKSPCSIVERQYITPNTEKSRSGQISTWLRNEGKMLNAAASKTWETFYSNTWHVKDIQWMFVELHWHAK